MHYIIYGAGDDGKAAMNMLGWLRCSFFYDTHKAGEIVQQRRVLNYEQLQEQYATGNYIIVVASSKYQIEMELFLKTHNMERYFVFNPAAFLNLNRYRPVYLLYGEAVTLPYSVVLMHYNVQNYSHIAISNINPALPYIISEVAFHCQDWRIDYIVDNSVEPGADVDYMGIPCRTLSEVENKIDCLLLTAACRDSDIRDMIPEVTSYTVIDCFDVLKFVPAYQHPELERFKGKHDGERCFIIGNGPSLRMNDLDKLQMHGEISFGVNEIFKAFKYTKWRPSYYCTADTDEKYFPEYDIYNYVSREQCEAFYGDPIHWSRIASGEIKDRNIFHVEQVDIHRNVNNMPMFSSDICAGVWAGGSILYCCIQIAAYLGFKQIYLLGADANFDDNADKEECFENHFIKNYVDDAIKAEYDLNLLDFDLSDPVTFQKTVMQSFRKAERYSKAHGFRIYNATRGGKLEEFERVEFDSLF